MSRDPSLTKKIPEHAERVFKGILHDVYQWQQELFDGTFTTFEAIKKHNAATVLATTKDKKIIVNFEEQPNRVPFIAIPGGIIEPNETMLENAKRELEEETGYVSKDWNLWFSFDIMLNSKIEWLCEIYIAKNSQKVGKVKFDAGEKIETKLLNFGEFLEITQDEKFRNKEISTMVKEMLDSKNKEIELEKFRKFIFGEN